MKKAKPSPKGSTLLAKIKKAKRPVAVKKLLAKANKIIAESVKAFVQKESLPQVEVPITSTPIKAEVKSLGSYGVILQKVQALTDMEEAEKAQLIEALEKGSEEIYANTVHTVDNYLDMSPEAFEAFKSAMGKKLTEIAGTPTPGLPPPSEVSPTGAEDEAVLQEWMKHTVKCVLDQLKFGLFDKTTLFQARQMISLHFDDTVHAGGVGPPALFETLGKPAVIYRTSQWLRHALESANGSFTDAQFKLFNAVFPPCSLPSPSAVHPFLTPSPDQNLIVTLDNVADWMLEVAKIVFDFIHWQPPTKDLLFKVREYIELGYEDDLLPRLPVNFPTAVEFPKGGVVYYVAMRVKNMLATLQGVFPDGVEDLFEEVFPLPDLSHLPITANIEFLLDIGQGPLPSMSVKNQEELDAAFGKLDASSLLDEYTAILLENTKKYLASHPCDAGYGPLDGPGIVQTMAPFSAVPNKSGHVYPADIWDKAVKKLQPAFSKEAEADAKAQGLGQECEDILSFESQDPGLIPEAEVTVVLENGEPFIVTSIGGEVVSKQPAIVAAQEITPKGLATLDRFGVVLKGDS